MKLPDGVTDADMSRYYDEVTGRRNMIQEDVTTLLVRLHISYRTIKLNAEELRGLLADATYHFSERLHSSKEGTALGKRKRVGRMQGN